MTYSKGQTLTLDLGNGDREYLVLDAAGDVVELLCRYSAGRGPFGSDGEYFGSAVDDFLENRFYDSLSKEAKAAIVPQMITQYAYDFDLNACSLSHQSYMDYYSKQLLHTEVRHVYLLDLKDIEEYFNHTFNSWQLRSLFPSPGNWLRSASSHWDSDAWVCYAYGHVKEAECSEDDVYWTPAFTIDLSKLSSSAQSDPDQVSKELISCVQSYISRYGGN